jgi:hypothetical protein
VNCPSRFVYIALKYKNLALAAVALAGISLGLSKASARTGNGDVSYDLTGPSGAIISKYLQASQGHMAVHGGSMQVDIDASVPRLKERGRLRALRQISKLGRVTYHVLGFQGDNTVKSQVIARYLEAEQQHRDNQKLTITPENYKFKFKGQKVAQDGASIYIFELSPRAKRVGLFKGELWLDASTCLPVLEKGRFVKNPSIFFRKVYFEQAFGLHNGAAVPERMSSTIDTRLVGKVQLNVSYSNFADESDEGEGGSMQIKPALISRSLP